jgi:putative transposase
MPRSARHVLANVPLHIVQRGSNRQPCFFADEDYARYLMWLWESADKCACAVHAYVLMSNHVHLLLTAGSMAGPSQMMKSIGQRYAQYLNRKYQRTGSPWEARYRSSIVEAEDYLLACHRYIELNPVRAQMVVDPGHYRWSSFHGNALGASDPLLRPHALYLSLGKDALEQRTAYRALFEGQQHPFILGQIRRAIDRNGVTGSAKFADAIALTIKRQKQAGSDGGD